MRGTANELRTTQKYKKYKNTKNTTGNNSIHKCIKENESRTEVPDTASDLRKREEEKIQKYKKYSTTIKIYTNAQMKLRVGRRCQAVPLT